MWRGPLLSINRRSRYRYQHRWKIGTATVKALVYVDDIATININVDDVYSSHEKVKLFSKKKRLASFSV